MSVYARSERADTYYCMLFNDEVHTYEQVIYTLQKAVNCSQKEAVSFATTVDRDVSHTITHTRTHTYTNTHTLTVAAGVAGQEISPVRGLPVLRAGQVHHCGEWSCCPVQGATCWPSSNIVTCMSSRGTPAASPSH